MNEFAELPNLHDALLDRIEVDWAQGSIVIDITLVPDRPIRIRLSTVTDFEMSRHQEWGPSVYINHAVASKADLVVFQMEMQSGDVISVSARELVMVGSS